MTFAWPNESADVRTSFLRAFSSVPNASSDFFASAISASTFWRSPLRLSDACSALSFFSVFFATDFASSSTAFSSFLSCAGRSFRCSKRICARSFDCDDLSLMISCSRSRAARTCVSSYSRTDLMPNDFENFAKILSSFASASDCSSFTSASPAENLPSASLSCLRASPKLFSIVWTSLLCFASLAFVSSRSVCAV